MLPSARNKAALYEPLKQQEIYAQKLRAIQLKIQQVEANLAKELTKIRTQLQEIGQACSEAEKYFDEINETSPGPAAETYEDSDSEESGASESESGESSDSDSTPRPELSSVSDSHAGGVYFVVDDVVEYDKLVAYLIGEELREILAARTAESAEASGNGRRSPSEAH